MTPINHSSPPHTFLPEGVNLGFIKHCMDSYVPQYIKVSMEGKISETPLPPKMADFGGTKVKYPRRGCHRSQTHTTIF
jgi:hypothetical protein